MVDTPILVNPVFEGSLRINLSPVLNPWFGRYILWAGTDIISSIPATVTVIDVENPATVAIPIDCLGLK